MASYFDEHDCEPLAEGQTPDQVLHLARLLLDTGLAAEWDMEFGRVFGGEKKVPTSKKFMDDLPTSLINPSEAALEKKCPVCIGLFDEEDEVKTLPCAHKFHTSCILPWLQKENLRKYNGGWSYTIREGAFIRRNTVNTCPLCRQEFPTDDPDYENYRKHKARAKQREYEIDTLHNSMFG